MSDIQGAKAVAAHPQPLCYSSVGYMKCGVTLFRQLCKFSYRGTGPPSEALALGVFDSSFPVEQRCSVIRWRSPFPVCPRGACHARGSQGLSPHAASFRLLQAPGQASPCWLGLGAAPCGPWVAPPGGGRGPPQGPTQEYRPGRPGLYSWVGPWGVLGWVGGGGGWRAWPAFGWLRWLCQVVFAIR